MEKPLEDFIPSKQRRDGRTTACRECTRTYNRERYAKHREKMRADARTRMAAWRAANPERARKNSTEATRKLREKDPDYAKRWYQKNIDRERERSKRVMREIRLERPEFGPEVMRRYRKRHAERLKVKDREKTYARRAKQPWSAAMAAHMAELVTQPCAYCGSTENITVDHVVPLSRGGKHEADNLAPACQPCNSSKCNRLLSEWSGRLAA